MNSNISEENEYVVKTFLENFEKYKNEPIALYGVGKNTEVLLKNIQGFNIIGLMDSECEGQVIYGKKVLSNAEIIQKCNKIIIIARPSVVNIIYKRISFLEEEYGIKIFNIEGAQFNQELTEDNGSENLSYWNYSEEDLKALIDRHDIISFDIFDTLITRKIVKPTDIYDVVERVLIEKYDIKINFKEVRILCENEMNNRLNSPNINQIYDEIQNKIGITDEIRELIKKVEYEVEYDYIVPRIKMIEIYNYSLENNKKVYLISDMYLDKNHIKELLHKCKIYRYEDILISSEINKTKLSGELFKYYKEKFDENRGRFLHIGDNKKSDIEMAQKCGMSTFEIMNPYDMLIYSSYKEILINIKTIEEKNILGLIISNIFNNPFILNKGRGKFVAENLQQIGYVFLGPVIFNFMLWLIKELLDSKYEAILFAARDGYLINTLYEIMTKNINLERIPKNIYFKTSRRAITVPNIKEEEDILFILKKPFKCTKEQLLKERFGIILENVNQEDEKVVISSENIEEIRKYVLSFMKVIIKNAKEEKKSYMKYINSLDIEKCKNIAVFDFCSSGTIQFYLSKLLNKKLQGFYFATMNFPNMYFKDDSQIKTLFGNAQQYYSKYNITKYYMLLESILTDPNNTLIRCTDDNSFVYNDGETKIKNFNNIKKCHDGIIEFVQDMIKIDNQLISRNVKPEFTDSILGLFISSKTMVEEEIKNTFYTESCYDFDKEYNVWETL